MHGQPHIRKNYSFVNSNLNLFQFNAELNPTALSALPGPLSTLNRQDSLQRFVLVALNACYLVAASEI